MSNLRGKPQISMLIKHFAVTGSELPIRKRRSRRLERSQKPAERKRRHGRQGNNTGRRTDCRECDVQTKPSGAVRRTSSQHVREVGKLSPANHCHSMELKGASPRKGGGALPVYKGLLLPPAGPVHSVEPKRRGGWEAPSGGATRLLSA